MTKNIFSVMALFFFVCCCVLATSWSIAERSAIQPRMLLTQWAENKKEFSVDDWQNATSIMLRAFERNPGNASFAYDIARLYEWNASQQPVWTEHAVKNRSKAIEFYKQALEKRPTWSSVWINLALSKTLNLEFGDEVKTALVNAMSYGVWEEGVFHNVLWLSLANWKNLPVTVQEKVIRLIKKTITKGRVPGYVEQIAIHFQWQENLQMIISSEVNR